MSKIFIKRPIFAIVIALMISLVGLLALFTLPVARFPQITPPKVSVRTFYLGATSKEVTDSVASVIEEQIMGVENMDYMVSNSSNDGSYSLTVTFKHGSNPNIDAVNVQNRVARAQAALPKIVQDVGVTTTKSSGSMDMVFALESPNKNYDEVFLKNYGSNYLIPSIKSIKGVGNVTSFGADYAMRIWLDPQKLAFYKVTVPEVMQAIKSQNASGPAGTIGAEPIKNSQQFQYSLSLNGKLKTPEQFGNILIRKDPSGNILRLKSLGRIELAANSYAVKVVNRGIPSAGFAISLTSDANSLETIGAVKKLLEKESKQFPEGMKYKVIIDSTAFVKASIIEVVETFVIALILVLFIVFLFLQSWRSTLIPMIAVPVSLLGTMAIFVPLGFTINTLTLFAMVLSIGLVVDDAIVVIEAVEYEMKVNKLAPKEATMTAMSKVQIPVIAVALVLSSVFVPVAFMGGISGVLYEQFALTIAISVLISAFVALSLTPALCGVMLKPHENIEREDEFILKRWFHKFHSGLEKFIGWYGRKLEGMSRRLYVPVLILLICLAVAGTAFKLMPRSFVPPEDNGYFITVANLPEGSSLNRTAQVVEKMMNYLYEDKDVDGVFGVAGFDMFSAAMKPNGGILFTSLKPWNERPGMDHSVFPKLLKSYIFANDNIPSANVFPVNPPSVPGLGRTSGVTMFLINRSGDSADNMMKVSENFLAEVKKDKHFTNAISTFNNLSPAFNYDINREKTLRDGVALQSIYAALQGIYGQIQVNDFTDFGQNFKVIIAGEPAFRMSPDTIKYIYVKNNRGQLVSLGNYLTPKATTVASTITRFNNYPAVRLILNAAPGVSSGEAINDLKKIASRTLPTGYTYDWSDSAREELKASNQSFFIFCMGFLFVFLILAALYESWKVPFAVLLTVPTGLLGASILPWLLHMSNNIFVQIGLLTLIGLTAKNAILIVEYAKVRVDKMNMDPVNASIEASKIRVRPILMTSFAFIFGTLPLIFSSGAGMLSRLSMGLTVVGGMLTATILGIFVIPMLFVLVEKVGFRKKYKGD